MSRTNKSLDELLKSASHVPERSEGYWESFPGRVTARLRERLLDAPDASWRPQALVWGVALATACVALALGIWLRQRPVQETGPQLAEQAKLYQQVASLFPNRLQAIVSDENGVQLVLSDAENVPSSTPFLLRICRANQCRSVITFSGQQIRVNGEMCDVLADAEGNIIVAGRSFAWSSTTPRRAAGSYRIEAQRLGTRS